MITAMVTSLGTQKIRDSVLTKTDDVRWLDEYYGDEKANDDTYA